MSHLLNFWDTKLQECIVWLILVFVCVCLQCPFSFYAEETPSTIIMGFVWSRTPLLIVCKKICSIWPCDNNPCSRSKGTLTPSLERHVCASPSYLGLHSLGRSKHANAQECCDRRHAFSRGPSQTGFRVVMTLSVSQILRNYLSLSVFGPFYVWHPNLFQQGSETESIRCTLQQMPTGDTCFSVPELWICFSAHLSRHSFWYNMSSCRMFGTNVFWVPTSVVVEL